MQSGRIGSVRNFIFKYSSSFWIANLMGIVALPYMKNPQVSPQFKDYFTKSWADVFQLSLTNFLATTFNSVCIYEFQISSPYIAFNETKIMFHYLRKRPLVVSLSNGTWFLFSSNDSNIIPTNFECILQTIFGKSWNILDPLKDCFIFDVVEVFWRFAKLNLHCNTIKWKPSS